jgi:hypothetical protein
VLGEQQDPSSEAAQLVALILQWRQLQTKRGKAAATADPSAAHAEQSAEQFPEQSAEMKKMLSSTPAQKAAFRTRVQIGLGPAPTPRTVDQITGALAACSVEVYYRDTVFCTRT